MGASSAMAPNSRPRGSAVSRLRGLSLLITLVLAPGCLQAAAHDKKKKKPPEIRIANDRRLVASTSSAVEEEQPEQLSADGKADASIQNLLKSKNDTASIVIPDNEANSANESILYVNPVKNSIQDNEANSANESILYIDPVNNSIQDNALNDTNELILLVDPATADDHGINATANELQNEMILLIDHEHNVSELIIERQRGTLSQFADKDFGNVLNDSLSVVHPTVIQDVNVANISNGVFSPDAFSSAQRDIDNFINQANQMNLVLDVIPFPELSNVSNVSNEAFVRVDSPRGKDDVVNIANQANETDLALDITPFRQVENVANISNEMSLRIEPSSRAQVVIDNVANEANESVLALDITPLSESENVANLSNELSLLIEPLSRAEVVIENAVNQANQTLVALDIIPFHQFDNVANVSNEASLVMERPSNQHVIVENVMNQANEMDLALEITPLQTYDNLTNLTNEISLFIKQPSRAQAVYGNLANNANETDLAFDITPFQQAENVVNLSNEMSVLIEQPSRAQVVNDNGANQANVTDLVFDITPFQRSENVVNLSNEMSVLIGQPSRVQVVNETNANQANETDLVFDITPFQRSENLVNLSNEMSVLIEQPSRAQVVNDNGANQANVTDLVFDITPFQRSENVVNLSNEMSVLIEQPSRAQVVNDNGANQANVTDLVFDITPFQRSENVVNLSNEMSVLIGQPSRVQVVNETNANQANETDLVFDITPFQQAENVVNLSNEISLFVEQPSREQADNENGANQANETALALAITPLHQADDLTNLSNEISLRIEHPSQEQVVNDSLANQVNEADLVIDIIPLEGSENVTTTSNEVAVSVVTSPQAIIAMDNAINETDETQLVIGIRPPQDMDNVTNVSNEMALLIHHPQRAAVGVANDVNEANETHLVLEITPLRQPENVTNLSNEIALPVDHPGLTQIDIDSVVNQANETRLSPGRIPLAELDTLKNVSNEMYILIDPPPPAQADIDNLINTVNETDLMLDVVSLRDFENGTNVSSSASLPAEADLGKVFNEANESALVLELVPVQEVALPDSDSVPNVTNEVVLDVGMLSFELAGNVANDTEVSVQELTAPFNGISTNDTVPFVVSLGPQLANNMNESILFVDPAVGSVQDVEANSTNELVLDVGLAKDDALNTTSNELENELIILLKPVSGSDNTSNASDIIWRAGHESHSADSGIGNVINGSLEVIRIVSTTNVSNEASTYFVPHVPAQSGDVDVANQANETQLVLEVSPLPQIRDATNESNEMSISIDSRGAHVDGNNLVNQANQTQLTVDISPPQDFENMANTSNVISLSIDLPPAIRVDLNNVVNEANETHRMVDVAPLKVFQNMTNLSNGVIAFGDASFLADADLGNLLNRANVSLLDLDAVPLQEVELPHLDNAPNTSNEVVLDLGMYSLELTGNVENDTNGIVQEIQISVPELAMPFHGNNTTNDTATFGADKDSLLTIVPLGLRLWIRAVGLNATSLMDLLREGHARNGNGLSDALQTFGEDMLNVSAKAVDLRLDPSADPRDFDDVFLADINFTVTALEADFVLASLSAMAIELGDLQALLEASLPGGFPVALSILRVQLPTGAWLLLPTTTSSTTSATTVTTTTAELKILVAFVISMLVQGRGPEDLRMDAFFLEAMRITGARLAQVDPQGTRIEVLIRAMGNELGSGARRLADRSNERVDTFNRIDTGEDVVDDDDGCGCTENRCLCRVRTVTNDGGHGIHRHSRQLRGHDGQIDDFEEDDLVRKERIDNTAPIRLLAEAPADIEIQLALNVDAAVDAFSKLANVTISDVTAILQEQLLALILNSNSTGNMTSDDYSFEVLKLRLIGLIYTTTSSTTTTTTTTTTTSTTSTSHLWYGAEEGRSARLEFVLEMELTPASDVFKLAQDLAFLDALRVAGGRFASGSDAALALVIQDEIVVSLRISEGGGDFGASFGGGPSADYDTMVEQGLARRLFWAPGRRVWADFVAVLPAPTAGIAFQVLHHLGASQAGMILKDVLAEVGLFYDLKVLRFSPHGAIFPKTIRDAAVDDGEANATRSNFSDQDAADEDVVQAGSTDSCPEPENVTETDENTTKQAHRSIVNLALGRVPIGSSDTLGARFAGATDGSTEAGRWWRGAEGEYPSYLILDLGKRAIVTSMAIVGGDPGFWSMKIYHSLDRDEWRGGPLFNWSFVRRTDTPLHCAAPGLRTVHEGWPDATRYIAIQMERNCSGIPVGPFSVAEWEVYGYYQEGMVRRYERSWPHCENLWSEVSVEEDPHVACFDGLELETAKQRCLANSECDGFSFQAPFLNGGAGTGCFKTACQAASTSNGIGRGPFGYWEKRSLAYEGEGNGMTAGGAPPLRRLQTIGGSDSDEEFEMPSAAIVSGHAEGSHGSADSVGVTSESKATRMNSRVRTNGNEISAGRFHSLFVDDTGTALATGGNDWGQLGDGTTRSRSAQSRVRVLSDVVAVQAGARFSLFLSNDGAVHAAGDMSSVFPGRTYSHLTRVWDGGIVAVSTGGLHVLVLTDSGRALGFGYNYYGQLGTGARRVTFPFADDGWMEVSGLSDVQDIAAGAAHSLFLDVHGHAWGCGRRMARLARGGGVDAKAASQNEPDDALMPMRLYAGVQAIAAGLDTSYFLLSDGSVRAAGANAYGQLGDGTTVDSYDVTVSALVGNVVHVAVGRYFADVGVDGALDLASRHGALQGHSLFTTARGEVLAAGSNGHGQLCDRIPADKRLNRSIPELVAWIPGDPAIRILGASGGEAHTLLLWTRLGSYRAALGEDQANAIGISAADAASGSAASKHLFAACGSPGSFTDVQDPYFTDLEQGAIASMPF
eukprot:TRINITY_DN26019_c0_g1_i3.p1 TRINITY_DN26019_c0_g1~~TRINITY_DN26019_c0_g1_i3.p1  ORF type:complete len:2828 (-),score=464.29 TRINITY_DN26019_c0_g1_i3:52-8535(-)